MYFTEILIPEILKRSQYYTTDPKDADYFLIPHYSTCHYHQCLGKAHFDKQYTPDFCKSLTEAYFKRVFFFVKKTYPFWEKLKGKHIFIFAWDQGSEIFGFYSSLHKEILAATFFTTLGKSTNDQTFNPEKDIVIPPYLDFEKPLSILQSYQDKFGSKNFSRRILASFRGTILDHWNYSYGVRQSLKKLLSARSDTIISDIHAGSYWDEMIQSEYCFAPSGWTVWSARMFECLLVDSVPIVTTLKETLFPFMHYIDYSKLLIRMTPEDFHSTNINNLLTQEGNRERRERIRNVKNRILYNSIPKENDAFESAIKTLWMRHHGML